MGIKLTNLKDIEKFLERSIQERETIIINRLHRVGLQFVTDARTKTRQIGYFATSGSVLKPDSQGFFDQTSVLRSSIGYVITHNGKVISSDFQGEKAEGIAQGSQFAEELTKDVEGFALICVAGANYAYYVEALGYDVITGSSITAEQNLKKYFK